MLKWVAWDSFEFEKASRFYDNSFHNPCAFYAKSYYAPFWCDMCNSSDSSLPLTQSMRLEVGEPFGLDASFGMNNALCRLEDTFDMNII